MFCFLQKWQGAEGSGWNGSGPFKASGSPPCFFEAAESKTRGLNGCWFLEGTSPLPLCWPRKASERSLLSPVLGFLVQPTLEVLFLWLSQGTASRCLNDGRPITKFYTQITNGIICNIFCFVVQLVPMPSVVCLVWLLLWLLLSAILGGQYGQWPGPGPPFLSP